MAHLASVWTELAKMFGFLKTLEPSYNFVVMEWQVVFSKDGCNNSSHPMYFPYNMTSILLPVNLGGGDCGENRMTFSVDFQG